MGGEEGTCGGVRGVLFSEEVEGKGDLGELGILPSQSEIGLKLLDPGLLIKTDQASLSCAIYAQLEIDPVLSTSGIIFLISFNIECLVVVFGLPRGLLPWHTADNNLAGTLSLVIRMILPRKVNLLFAISSSTLLILLNLFLTCTLEIFSSLTLSQLIPKILLIHPPLVHILKY